MKQTWTIRDIEQLKADGKIRDFTRPPAPAKTGGRKVAKHYPKRSKEKDWIGWNLLAWCSERGLVHEEEYRFDAVRKWRLDYAIKEIMVGLEYNGVFSEKSRHLTAVGHTGDTNKLNAAQAQGWRIIQLTPLNYKELINELNKYYERI